MFSAVRRRRKSATCIIAKALAESLPPSLRHLAPCSVSEGKTKLARNLVPNLRNLAPAGVFETTPMRASFGSPLKAQLTAIGGGFRTLSNTAGKRVPRQLVFGNNFLQTGVPQGCRRTKANVLEAYDLAGLRAKLKI